MTHTKPHAWVRLPSTIALAAAMLATSCAPVREAHLRAPPPDASQPTQTAYAEADKAYARCADAYATQRIPWQIFVVAGAGAVAAVALTGAAATPFIVEAGLATQPTVQAPVNAVVMIGLAVVAAAAVGVGGYFGAEILGAVESAKLKGEMLNTAHGQALEAATAADADRLNLISRGLYEDCRAIDAGKSGSGTSVVLQDLQRYRREADEGAKRLAESEKHKSDLDAVAKSTDDKLRTASEERDQAKARLADAENQLAELQSQLSSAQGEVARLEEDRAKLSKRELELLEEKKKLEEKTSHYEDIAKALQAEVSDGRVQLRRLRDGVVVEMSNQVLFPSGSADLNDKGKETLAKVAEAIKTLKDRRIRIEGHTDNVPVGKGGPFPSNWELSSARAIAVTRALQDGGVSPSMMSAEARAEYAPVASNKAPNGRARNRRIEIYLVPQPLGSKESWEPPEGAAPAPAKSN